ncbi:Bgt-499 [Blumeria graminis f. sp. tritici]|uniref:DNA 3'-5' helicase n=2 Tax=Blumeria graminis f. sp. tritici TaxID=62690 RepID=A0A9X9ML73_BLUGR|nr:Bgt-499 [Blumeria graminis f. sp. tritici]
MTRHNLDIHVSWLLSQSDSQIAETCAHNRTHVPQRLDSFHKEPQKDYNEEQSSTLTSSVPTNPNDLIAISQHSRNMSSFGSKSMGKLTSTLKTSRPSLITGQITNSVSKLLPKPTPNKESATCPKDPNKDLPFTKINRQNLPAGNKSHRAPLSPRPTSDQRQEVCHKNVESVDLTSENEEDLLMLFNGPDFIPIEQQTSSYSFDKTPDPKAFYQKSEKEKNNHTVNSGFPLVLHKKIAQNSFVKQDEFVDVDEVLTFQKTNISSDETQTHASQSLHDDKDLPSEKIAPVETPIPQIYGKSEVSLQNQAMSAPKTPKAPPINTKIQASLSSNPKTQSIDGGPEVTAAVQVAASPSRQKIIFDTTNSQVRQESNEYWKQIVINDSDDDELLPDLERVFSSSIHNSAENSPQEAGPYPSSKVTGINEVSQIVKTKGSMSSTTSAKPTDSHPRIPQNFAEKPEVSLSPLSLEKKPNLQESLIEESSQLQTPPSSLFMEDKKLVNLYLKYPSSIELFRERASNSLAQNSIASMAYIDADEPAPLHLKDERRKLLGNLKSYAELETLHIKHQSLIDEKKTLVRRVMELLDSNMDTSSQEERQSAISQDVKTIEHQLAKLLHSSGAVNDGFGSENNDNTFLKNLHPVANTIEDVIPKKLARSATEKLQADVNSQFLTKQKDLIRSNNTSRELSPFQKSPHTYSCLPTRSHLLTYSVSPSPASHTFESTSNMQRLTSKKPEYNLLNSQSREFHNSHHDTKLFEEDEDISATLLNEAQRTDEEQDEVEFYGDESFGDSEYDEDMLFIAQQVENQDPTSHTKNSIKQQPISGESRHLNEGLKLNCPSNQKNMYSPVENQALLFRYPWSKDVKKMLKERFKLKGFRHHQLEAINATLNGEDAFILMPTGGGKSLCYQLPAVVQSGKTKGVTIVVSPLLSLMHDQVEHLRKNYIQAATINGDTDSSERREIMNNLRQQHPEQHIQLLYVTPEMVSQSGQMGDILSSLNQRSKLARFVIDEAHCVSQWGHDFRKEYIALSRLRKDFPSVPIMALTATATENVKNDVINNLGMGKPPIFSQSFNRPNLYYEVRPKSGRKMPELLKEIADLVTRKYRGQTGIIYTLSRKGCEDMAKKLSKEFNISVHHYHAGMKSEEKTKVQRDWQSGKLQVVVATIAFGMGIDKPDVRFVIHYTIPKSLEGYYQETGRAGRDGKKSGCYLYYSWGDTVMLRKFIFESDTKNDQKSTDQKEREWTMLQTMIGYCDNRADCRRMQVLRYFGETFLKNNCRHSCDNCSSGILYESKNFTNCSKFAMGIVRHLKSHKATVLNCVELLQGKKTKSLSKFNAENFEEFGSCKEISRGDLERVMYRLILENALVEESVVNVGNFTSQYIRLGPNSRDFMTGRRKVHLDVPVELGKYSTTDSASKYPTSTILTSPIPHTISKRQTKQSSCVSEAKRRRCTPKADFGTIVEPASSRICRLPKSMLGPPITIDQQLAQLPDIHRDLVYSFVEQAKVVEERLRNKTGVRKPFFSEANFREMAIAWPMTLEDMKEMTGINIERVESYGEYFIPLVKHFYNSYNEMMGSKMHEKEGDMDRNHQNVVIVSDDDDDDHESILDEEQEIAVQTAERSHHFYHPTQNERGTQRDFRSSRGRGRGRGGVSKKSVSRKSNRAATGLLNAGIVKRGKPKSIRSAGTSGSTLSRRYMYGGGHNGTSSGIGMMPT